MQNCKKIIENRAYTTRALRDLGFTVLDSKTNFVFAKHPDISGEALYLKLKEAGILVRHFDKKEISDFNRITIGTKAQMESLISEIKKILEG
jgi:histidinol-phosphate aminotransferase